MFTASFQWSDVWTVTEELHFRRAVAGYREADHKCNDHIWGQLRISGVTTMQNNRVSLIGILSSRIMTWQHEWSRIYCNKLKYYTYIFN
jgi:hypothetical protein